METGGRIDQIRGGDTVTFAQALETLKARGSALLVTGCVPDEMYVKASSQMLGDRTATPPRRRLVVVPEAGDGDTRRVQSSGSTAPEWARIVVCGTEARSAAAATTDIGTHRPASPIAPPSAAPSSEPDGGPSVKQEIAGCDVGQLGSTISTIIDEFDRAAGGLEPAELRVAFDCLPPLLSRHGREASFRFLHTFTHDVKRVSGMAHVWLPQSRSSELASTFSPLFDAVIELEIDDGELRQRWHFRDVDLTSEWLPIE